MRFEKLSNPVHKTKNTKPNEIKHFSAFGCMSNLSGSEQTWHQMQN